MFHKLSPIAIDISDTSIEMAQVRLTGVRRMIFALSRVKLPAGIVENGNIINEELLKQKIKLLLQKSLPRNFSGKKISLTIPAKRTFADIFSVPKQIAKKNIQSYLDNSAQAKFPVQTKNYTLIYRQLNPADNFINYYVAAIPKKLINQYRILFSKLGFNVEKIDLEALSLGRALIKQKPKPGQAVSILDIGAKTTDLHIFNKNGLAWSSTLNLGGDLFSRDISQKMSLNLKQAEIFKRQYGFLANKKEGRVLNILQACFQPIINHLNTAINYYQRNYKDHVVQLIISGGSALIPGVVEYLSENLSLNTALANPLIKLRFKKWTWQWPPIFFSNVLGLCLWRVQNNNLKDDKDDVFFTKKIRKLILPQWIKKLLLAVVIGLIVTAGVFILIRSRNITIEPSSSTKFSELKAVGFLGNDLAQLNNEIKESLDRQAITIVPAQQFKIEKKLTKQCLASGISDQIVQAQGKVTIFNNTDKPQTLVKNTRLLSEQKILFRLQEQEVIPANSQKEVLVIADQAGEVGNVGPSLFVIPGLSQDLQEKIFGQSHEVMTGGGDKMHFIQQNDIDLCLSNLDQEIIQISLTQLNQELNSQAILIKQPIKQITIDQKLPQVNELVISFDVTFQKQIIFAVLDKQVLQALIVPDQSSLDDINIVVDKLDLDNQLIYLIIKTKVES